MTERETIPAPPPESERTGHSHKVPTVPSSGAWEPIEGAPTWFNIGARRDHDERQEVLGYLREVSRQQRAILANQEIQSGEFKRFRLATRSRFVDHEGQLAGMESRLDSHVEESRVEIESLTTEISALKAELHRLKEVRSEEA